MRFTKSSSSRVTSCSATLQDFPIKTIPEAPKVEYFHQKQLRDNDYSSNGKCATSENAARVISIRSVRENVVVVVAAQLNNKRRL